MRPRVYFIGFILTLTFASALSACKTPDKYARPPETRYQEAEPPVMISEGIKADYHIANELNNLQGIQGAAVLIKNGTAYVGTHVIGDEHKPDAYQKRRDYTQGTQTGGSQGPGAMGAGRSQYSGKGIPKNQENAPNTTQNGVTQSGEPIKQYRQETGTQPSPVNPGTATGNIDLGLVKQIETKVKSMAPDVNKVHVTANYENVTKLQGYARYIQDGGSMQRVLSDFTQTINRIWPDATP